MAMDLIGPQWWLCCGKWDGQVFFLRKIGDGTGKVPHVPHGDIGKGAGIGLLKENGWTEGQIGSSG